MASANFPKSSWSGEYDQGEPWAWIGSLIVHIRASGHGASNHSPLEVEGCPLNIRGHWNMSILSLSLMLEGDGRSMGYREGDMDIFHQWVLPCLV